MALLIPVLPVFFVLTGFANHNSRHLLPDEGPFLWQLEQWHFGVILVLLVLEALLIALLLRQRRYMKHMQAGLCSEISERKAAEQALQDLGGRLITAQEAERIRIANELHDDMSQRLALLSVDLDQLAQCLTTASAPEGEDGLRRALERTRGISRDIVRLAHDLHSSKLDRLGLVSASMSLCREISEQQSLKVEFSFKDLPESIPRDVALCLYRVLQECLNNIVKHSGALRAQVELSGSADAIELCISDQGVGFHADEAQASWGLGLISMRERLRLVGGQIAIDSQPLRGTRVQASVPFIAVPAAQ